jgi:hypothetical protein
LYVQALISIQRSVIRFTHSTEALRVIRFYIREEAYLGSTHPRSFLALSELFLTV